MTLSFCLKFLGLTSTYHRSIGYVTEIFKIKYHKFKCRDRDERIKRMEKISRKKLQRGTYFSYLEWIVKIFLKNDLSKHADLGIVCKVLMTTSKRICIIVWEKRKLRWEKKNFIFHRGDSEESKYYKKEKDKLNISFYGGTNSTKIKNG